MTLYVRSYCLQIMIFNAIYNLRFVRSHKLLYSINNNTHYTVYTVYYWLLPIDRIIAARLLRYIMTNDLSVRGQRLIIILHYYIRIWCYECDVYYHYYLLFIVIIIIYYYNTPYIYIYARESRFGIPPLALCIDLIRS